MYPNDENNSLFINKQNSETNGENPKSDINEGVNPSSDNKEFSAGDDKFFNNDNDSSNGDSAVSDIYVCTQASTPADTAAEAFLAPPFPSQDFGGGRQNLNPAFNANASEDNYKATPLSANARESIPNTTPSSYKTSSFQSGAAFNSSPSAPPRYESETGQAVNSNTNNSFYSLPQPPARPLAYQGYGVNPPLPSPLPKKKKKGLKNVLAAALLVMTMVFSGYSGAWFMRETIESQTEPQTSGVEESTAQSNIPSGAVSGMSASSGSNTIAEVAEKAGPSVVEISTEYTQFHPFYGQYVSTGAGSGVILSSDGYIVTNYHVIEGASSIIVRLSDGTEYSASVVGYESRESDLAVLKIAASGLKAVEFADSDTIQVGQAAIAIGNPLGELGGTVTEGIISARERLIYLDNTPMHLLQTSAAINPGNSGGGLFDGNGNLVGIVVAKSSGEDIEGLGFAIPSNTVAEIVSRLIGNV